MWTLQELGIREAGQWQGFCGGVMYFEVLLVLFKLMPENIDDWGKTDVLNTENMS